MIYWFTGQPGSGKTVLANLLKEQVLPHAYRIDGDEMRELFANKDYSENNINKDDIFGDEQTFPFVAGLGKNAAH